MIENNFTVALTIIGVITPVVALLFNFLSYRFSSRSQEGQQINGLEESLQKESEGKLAALNRENLERLKFKQATGYAENFPALRMLFCDMRHSLTVSQFRAARVLCKIKNDHFVGFDWISFCAVLFGLITEIFFIRNGLISAKESPYLVLYKLFFFSQAYL